MQSGWEVFQYSCLKGTISSVERNILHDIGKNTNKLVQYILHIVLTHGDKKLHTLLVKYFNDLLDGQKSLQLSPRNICEDFFLKIGILSPKVYTKNVPNVQV